MAWKCVSIAFVFIQCIVTVYGSTDNGRPVVQTQYGPVRGVNVREGVIFFGLPFAAPPTGQFRWSPPEPLNKAWAPNIYDATRTRPSCPCKGCNPSHTDSEHVCPLDMQFSEDCLYLNIFAPTTILKSVEKIPVMYFMHGGGFQETSRTSPLYDGRFLANKTNSIVVTANYRLGVLGFLVAGQGKDAATGNYAILDQRAGMKWIQENIGSFGGDKERVTLFGQSAGAISIGVHLTTNQSASLFHQAIMMSLPFTIRFKEKWESLLLGNYVTSQLYCAEGDMNCLRSKSTGDILHAQRSGNRHSVNPLHPTERFLPWAPTVDGDVISVQTFDSFTSGNFQRKPFIIGNTKEEGIIFVYQGWAKTMTKATYYEVMLEVFLNKALEVLRQYPPTASADQRPGLSVAVTDWIFTCPTRNVVRHTVAYGGTDVWLYIFDHVWSFKDIWDTKKSYCIGHVCHGEDIPFVFQTAPLFNQSMTTNEQILADSMAYYFGNFAHTGNPNKAAAMGDHPLTGALDWPRYNKDGGYININITTPIDVLGKDYRREWCVFWDKLNKWA